MRIDQELKDKIQHLADHLGMSSTALVQLVMRSFIAKPKLEIDMTEEWWNDTYFDKPVDAQSFISWLEEEIWKSE